MRRINKHQSTLIPITDFSGGINVALTAEQIADNQMQECVNFWYAPNSRRLVGRGGLSEAYASFDSMIRDVFYDIDTNLSVIALDNGQAFTIVGNNVATLRHIGVLSANSVPSYVKFQNKLWVASGGKLQYYDFGEAGTLKTVTESPLCDIVFVRMARLAVTKSGDDMAYYSWVGDGEKWEDVTNDASTGKSLEIGYGDSGNIIAVVPLATDLIFFKHNGLIYQLSGDGDFRSWVVNSLATNSDIKGFYTAVNLGGSNVVFVAESGLKSLQATMDYGNIAPSDIGDNFNKLIVESMYEPRFFNLRRHKTLLIRPNNDWTYFVAFNYRLGVATELRFAMPIHALVETPNEVFVASGHGMHVWDEAYTLDVDKTVEYRLSPKSILRVERVLLKSIDAKFSANNAGDVTVSDGGRLSVKMPANSRRKVRCNHSADELKIEVVSNTRVCVDHVVLEVADL